LLPLVPLLLLSPPFFSDYSFLVHHPVNWDDQHPLAHAMASDFTVARQFSQREQLFFRYGSNSTLRLVTYIWHCSFVHMYLLTRG
jgi:hypothetical protein